MFIDFMESDTGARDAVTNAGTLSHAEHIHKWRGGGHSLNEPLPAVEWFAAARHMAVRAQQSLESVCLSSLTVQQCFGEGTCYEEPAKGNKQK